MNWGAYIDESEPDPRADPGVYLLAAALVPGELIEEVRSAVAPLRLPGRRTLHRRDENDQRRKLLTVAVAESEAREAKQNQRDLQLLGILRAERTITSAIRMAHLAGPLEALLWLPDLVAAAVGAARQGHCGYLDQLSGQLTILEA